MDDSGFTFFDQPKPMPAIEWLDNAGNIKTLDDYLGSVVLINLWATWCAPCVQEMPALERTQERFGLLGLKIIPINVEELPIGQLVNFYNRLGLETLNIHQDPSQRVMLKLNADSLPASFLFTRTGKWLGGLSGVPHWDGGPTQKALHEVLMQPVSSEDMKEAFTRRNAKDASPTSP